MPSDVRKRSALPSAVPVLAGLGPDKGAQPKIQLILAGRPKAFPTSGGKAESVLLKNRLQTQPKKHQVQSKASESQKEACVLHANDEPDGFYVAIA